MDETKKAPKKALNYIFDSGVLTPGASAQEWNTLSSTEKEEMKEHAYKEMDVLGIVHDRTPQPAMA